MKVVWVYSRGLSSYRMELAMPAKRKLTTTVSTKGQVILPRRSENSGTGPPGRNLVVEDTPRGCCC